MAPPHHLVLLFIAPFLIDSARACVDEPLDLLIHGGRLVDGSGNPWRYADVGVRGDSIVAIGDLSAREAARRLDATGLVVAPGFIDTHTHCDDGLDEEGSHSNWNYLRQGVTTVVTGNCGSGTFEVAAFGERIDERGIGTQCAHLMGFGDIRRSVLGDASRAPNADELERMRSIVRRGMTEGAWGMSTGLEYTPDCYADTDEIVAMARVVAEQGGVYMSHQRNEFDGVVEATRETIQIARDARLPVLTSHFKACGKENWGTLRDAVALIDAARADGVPVFADQYPYDKPSVEPMISIRSNSGWSCFRVPDDMEPFRALRSELRAARGDDDKRATIRERYVDALSAALDDDASRVQIKRAVLVGTDVDPSPVARAGWDSYGVVSSKRHPELMGRVLSDVAKERGQSGFDLAAELVVEEPDMILTSGVMSPDDVRAAMRRPWLMISSDGDAFAPVSPDADPEVGHPRSFSSQARVLRKFVREEGVLTLEDAVRKMTSLPASFLGMTTRGLVAVGFKADLVLFDPEIITDRATFLDARVYATGVEYVLIGGRVAVDAGEPTDELHGRLLRWPEDR